MKVKIRVAVVGYGNVGKFAVSAVKEEKDMTLAGVVIPVEETSPPPVLQDVPFVNDIRDLKEIDVAILCIPSRNVLEEAVKYLKQSISTVDCFDIHGAPLRKLRETLDSAAKENNAASIISAGWDPGTNSLIRCVMEMMVPRGLTYTNFGPGMSLGHTVAAKSASVVEDAVSITVPIGEGIHRRIVYVKLLPGTNKAEVEQAIKSDKYFSESDTHVIPLEDLDNAKDMGHSVSIERKGRAGIVHNQCLHYTHSINNPALTSQVMVSAARAVVKQKPGCYTLPEIPLADFLQKSLEQIIAENI